MSNVKQIGMGLIMYANENYESFPSDTAYGGARPAMRGLNLLYDTYVSDVRVFNCPSDGNVTNAASGDVANVFMCVADDNSRPIMRAWRRMPKAEGWRDHDNRQDKFQVTSRFGFGAQRVDSLGILLSNPATY